MASPRYYENGAWKAICDQCGREFRAYLLNKRWDGLMVCPGDWEPRQPQDFVRGVADKIVPPWTRPEQEDEFIFSCDAITSQGSADYGEADCAMADINNGLLPECTFEGNSATAGYAVAGCVVAGNPYPGIV